MGEREGNCLFSILNIAEAHTFISEEKLKVLIKSTFLEEFQKQEKNIINIVIDNFKITMKKIKDLKAEVSDLKDSLEFTENFIEKKLKNWKLNQVILKAKFKKSGTTR